MKVIHVTSSDMSLKYLLLDQLIYLRERGHDVSAISAPGPWVKDVRAAGIPVTTVPLTRQITPARDLRALSALITTFLRQRPDIVHTHTPKATLLGQWAALAARVPHRVHTIHGLYFPGHMRVADRWRYVWLERVQMAPAHLVLSQNEEDIATAARDRIFDPRRIRYLGNGIDVERFHPRNRTADVVDKVRASLGIPAGSTVVGMVGRMTGEKGYREYFSAAAMVRASNPAVTFLAIGPNEPWKPDAVTESDARVLGLRDGLLVLGHREDMDDLYAAMDVLVLPSHREGFPRAPMEAAASGLPVIVSDERGCRATVVADESGLLVPVGDASALAAAMLRLIADSELRERMGRRGRQIALERFDQRLVFERVIRGYEDLAAGMVIGTKPSSGSRDRLGS
jgi:glycosyltransferase involved in cell wall biosynthesis